MSSQINFFKPPNDHHYLHMNIYCQASKKSSYALYFDFPCGVEVFIELKHYDDVLMDIHPIHILTHTHTKSTHRGKSISSIIMFSKQPTSKNLETASLNPLFCHMSYFYRICITNPQPSIFLFHQKQSSTTYKHQPSTSHTKI